MKKWLITVIVSVFTVSLALADGDCPTRKMNGAEAAELQALQNTIRASLPEPPADYKANDSGFNGQVVCESQAPDEMLRMNFEVEYMPDGSRANGQMESSIMDKMKGTPEQQKKLAAIEAREKELQNARKSARDQGEKDRIREQLKAVRAEERALRDEIDARYQEWVLSGGQQKMMQNLQGSLPKGNFSVKILVNQDVYVQDKAKPYPVQGASLALEESDKWGDSRVYCITVLFGPFEKGGGRYELRNAKRGVSTKARGIGVVFMGPGDRADGVRDLVKKTNLAKLKATIR